MTLPKHLGDIREPHPVHCHIHTRQTWWSILTCPNERSTRAEPLRTESTRQWTESDALDPMIEKPQKAQVLRIKIEAVSLDSTSMAPSLDGPILAKPGLSRTATTCMSRAATT